VVGGRPDDVAGEGVALALPLELLVTEAEIHGDPPSSLTD
jgi:hypothetical protein